MKSFNKTSFGLGLLLGSLIIICLGFTSSQNQQNSEYHLTFNGSNGYAFVYNSSTGNFKKFIWREVKDGGNLKELLEE